MMIPIWMILLVVAVMLVLVGVTVMMETRVEQLTRYIERREKLSRIGNKYDDGEL